MEKNASSFTCPDLSIKCDQTKDGYLPVSTFLNRVLSLSLVLFYLALASSYDTVDWAMEEAALLPLTTDFIMTSDE